MLNFMKANMTATGWTVGSQLADHSKMVRDHQNSAEADKRRPICQKSSTLTSDMRTNPTEMNVDMIGFEESFIESQGNSTNQNMSNDMYQQLLLNEGRAQYG